MDNEWNTNNDNNNEMNNELNNDISTASTDSYSSLEKAYEEEQDAIWRQNLPFRDFYKDYCSISTKKNIKAFCIFLYVSCGITIALYLLVLTALMSGQLTDGSTDLFTVITNIVCVTAVLIMTIFVHTKQNRACAAIIAIYAIVTSILSGISTGKPSGIAVLLCSVFLCLHTFSAHREYKKFKE